MATPTILTETEFTSSRYGDIEINGRLDELIVHAERAIQDRLHRLIAPTVYTERFRPGTNTLFLLNRPIISLDSVTRRANYLAAWETLDLATFYVRPDAGYAESLAGQVADYEVEVVYTAGLTDVPPGLKEAVILQVVLFNFQDTEVFGAGDGKEPGLKYVEREIERLIAPFMQTATVSH